MSDSSQTIVNKYSYDSFGKIMSQVEAVAQPFKFVGQFGVMTEPNGFYYMRARYYDPSVGRFISEDPKGFDGGGTNLFVYAANNPILLFDPLGLAPGDWWEPIAHPIEFYNRAREVRNWAQDNFSDQDFMRHFHASYIIADEYGAEWARALGAVNEYYGFFRYDLPDLPGRIRGEREWAFEIDDFVANEAGILSATGNKTCK